MLHTAEVAQTTLTDHTHDQSGVFLTNRLYCTLYLQWGDHDGVLVCYGDYQVDQTLVVQS